MAVIKWVEPERGARSVIAYLAHDGVDPDCLVLSRREIRNVHPCCLLEAEAVPDV